MVSKQADKGETEVAVKIFSRYDDTSCDSSTELIKNYSDMRYELNKLSSLEHPHIVRFIGVFTNPHCFVLEWAPEKTLQHIHQKHAENSINFCTTSLFLVLLQVYTFGTVMHGDGSWSHGIMKTYSLIPSLSHSQPHTLPATHTSTLSHSHPFTCTPSLSHFHPLTLPASHTPTLSRSHPLTLPASHTHSH